MRFQGKPRFRTFQQYTITIPIHNYLLQPFTSIQIAICIQSFSDQFSPATLSRPIFSSHPPNKSLPTNFLPVSPHPAAAKPRRSRQQSHNRKSPQRVSGGASLRAGPAGSACRRQIRPEVLSEFLFRNLSISLR